MTVETRTQPTLQELTAAYPDQASFITKMLVVASGLMGSEDRVEPFVAKTLAQSLLHSGILGERINLLARYTSGDAKLAYQVLTQFHLTEAF